MTVALALLAAAVFGTGDFLGGYATRQARLLAVLTVTQGVGLVGMAAVALAVHGAPTLVDVGLGAFAGLSGGAGVAMLYQGLAVGAMSVVAPITGVVAAVIPVGAGVALGERPGALQLAGIAGAIVAVGLLSGAPRRDARATGAMPVMLGLGAGAAFGLFYIALARTHSAGGLWPLVAARSTSVSVFGIASVAARTPPRFTRRIAAVVVTAGALDVAANALYLLAVHRGLLSIVAVLVSLYPGATVICSFALLGERLSRQQSAGVLLALLAVVLIGAGQGP